jgi:hypothetical protein
MFFPQSNIKTAGRKLESQNEKCGVFIGHFRSMRPIQSAKNPTCFGVIDIIGKDESTGQIESNPFQLYLNYNTSKEKDEKGKTKEEKSQEYLVSKTKEILEACGKTPDMSAERDNHWCEEVLEKIISENPEFKFEQKRTSRGLEIDFITTSKENW